MSIIVGCSCDSVHGNTGTPNCVEMFGLASGLGITSVLNGLGVQNSISLVTPSTTFTDNLTNADRTERIFPVKNLRNVTFPLEDTTFETDNTNQKEFVRDGVQSFLAEVWRSSNVFMSKLRQGRCNRNAAWIFTPNGVIGVRDDQTFYPIEINAYDPRWMFQDGTQSAKGMIGFDFDASVDKGQLWLVSYADLGTSYAAIKGLIDVNYTVIDAAAAGASNTTVGLQLNTDYGSGLAVGEQDVDGLVLANFLITNTTTGLTVTAVSVEEDPGVKYTFTFPNQTALDKIRISVLTSTGFEGSVQIIAP